MDMSEESRIVGLLRERWATAFAARNLDGLAALYAPDVLFFGSTPELFRGHAGVRAYFAGLSSDISLEAFEEPELVGIAPVPKTPKLTNECNQNKLYLLK